MCSRVLSAGFHTPSTPSTPATPETPGLPLPLPPQKPLPSEGVGVVQG